MSVQGGAFWAFTLATYPREGVKEAVLRLQDRRGADVNLLLFCCWVAADGRGRLAAEALARADAAADAWRRAVTLRLRAVRDDIRGEADLWALEGAAAVREKVLAAEIESERVTQGLLERQAPEPRADAGAPERAADAAASLEAYVERLGFVPDAEDRRALETLLAAAFPDAGRAPAERPGGGRSRPYRKPGAER